MKDRAIVLNYKIIPLVTVLGLRPLDIHLFKIAWISFHTKDIHEYGERRHPLGMLNLLKFISCVTWARYKSTIMPWPHSMPSSFLRCVAFYKVWKISMERTLYGCQSQLKS